MDVFNPKNYLTDKELEIYNQSKAKYKQEPYHSLYLYNTQTLDKTYIRYRYDKDNKTGAETGNYTIWNSVINYDINKTYKAYLKVDNLFDKYYQTVDGYATEERSAYIGLKASF